MAEKNEKRNVRVELNAEQHKTLRLAAALSDQAMAEFAREAVLASAMKVTSDCNSRNGRSARIAADRYLDRLLDRRLLEGGTDSKVQGTQRARRVKKAGYTPKNVRADLEAIVDAAASRVRERYILWRKMFEERQTGVPSDYEPGPQWDGGLDAAGQTHPPIWPRIAKVLLAREFDVDAYIQAAFTLCEGGQPSGLPPW